MCQKALSHERIRYNKTKKNLYYVWNVYVRLKKIVLKILY